jgi:hypothetical protein
MFWPVHRLSSYGVQSTASGDNRIFVGATALIGVRKEWCQTSSVKLTNFTGKYDNTNTKWTASYDGKVTPPSFCPTVHFKGGFLLDSLTNLDNPAGTRPKMAVWDESPNIGDVGVPSAPFASAFSIPTFPTLKTLTANPSIIYGGGGVDYGCEAKFLGTNPNNNVMNVFSIKGSMSMGVLKQKMGGKNISGLASPAIGFTCSGGHWKLTGKMTYKMNNGQQGTYNVSNYDVGMEEPSFRKTLGIDIIKQLPSTPIYIYDYIMKFWSRTGVES